MTRLIPNVVLLLVAIAVLSLLPAGQGIAEPLRLKPFKDKLFQYQRVMQRTANGRITHIHYDEMRDVNGRDKVPARRAKSKYVSKLRSGWQRSETLSANGRTVNFMSAGTQSPKARLVVIYLHGRGGDRKQGMNDWTFGGNFNRVKNLMARNGGRFVTVDVKDFKERGKQDVFALMRKQKAQSPKAKIYLACGSMGGFVCWQLAKDEASLRYIDGMLLLGSMWDDGFLGTSAIKTAALHIPVYIAHGTKDKTYGWKRQMAFFLKIRKAAPAYPIKITLFEGGIHGTPIRMVDWRSALNWMLRYNKAS